MRIIYFNDPPRKKHPLLHLKQNWFMKKIWDRTVFGCIVCFPTWLVPRISRGIVYTDKYCMLNPACVPVKDKLVIKTLSWKFNYYWTWSGVALVSSTGGLRIHTSINMSPQFQKTNKIYCLLISGGEKVPTTQTPFKHFFHQITL